MDLYTPKCCHQIRCHRCAAENTSTPVVMLVQLARHTDPDVRIAVAENPSTPRGLKQFLSMDECADVRYAIAENPHTDTELLQLLQSDENPYVAARAKRTLDAIPTDRAPVLSVTNLRKIFAAERKKEV